MELLLGKLRTAAKANAFRLEPPWQVVEPLLVRCNPFGDSISVNSEGPGSFGKMLFVSGELS